MTANKWLIQTVLFRCMQCIQVIMLSEATYHTQIGSTKMSKQPLNVCLALLQDRVKRIEQCINNQSKVPSDPTVKEFGMSIKGNMMEVGFIAELSCFLHAAEVMHTCLNMPIDCKHSVDAVLLLQDALQSQACSMPFYDFECIFINGSPR